MGSITVTNQRASEAFRGQAAIVTLNSTDAANLANLVIGQKCEASSSSTIGYITEIDALGTTFKVIPQQPDMRFDSDTQGILKASETITITT